MKTKVGNGVFSSFEIAAGAWFTCTRPACGHVEFSSGRYYLKRANRCPVCGEGLFLSETFIRLYVAYLEERESKLTRMIADYRGYLDNIRAGSTNGITLSETDNRQFVNF